MSTANQPPRVRKRVPPPKKPKTWSFDDPDWESRLQDEMDDIRDMEEEQAAALEEELDNIRLQQIEEAEETEQKLQDWMDEVRDKQEKEAQEIEQALDGMMDQQRELAEEVEEALNDFDTPDPRYIGSTTPESLAYWESVVLGNCGPANRHIPDIPTFPRDVFATGSIIVKSTHLKAEAPHLGYSTRHKNEVTALEVARKALCETGIKVPSVLFSGKIRGHDVIVETRIPGVGLNVA